MAISRKLLDDQIGHQHTLTGKGGLVLKVIDLGAAITAFEELGSGLKGKNTRLLRTREAITCTEARVVYTSVSGRLPGPVPRFPKCRYALPAPAPAKMKVIQAD